MGTRCVSPWGNTNWVKDRWPMAGFPWVAMLYSTGMGAGLDAFSGHSGEPVFSILKPPELLHFPPDIFALEYTFFHWGADALGILWHVWPDHRFSCIWERGRLMLSSSVLNGKYHRPWLIVPIDVITIISTLFGVVGAVGLGSRQLLAGFRELFGMLDVNYTNNAYVVVFLGSLATLSAFTGLSNGIRNLSRFNILLAFVFNGLYLAGRRCVGCIW